MVKKELSLLNNKPNIFNFPQSTIDSMKIDEEDRELFISSVKMFSARSKSHFTYKFVDYHLKNNFKAIDITKISKYPLLAVYNKPTKKIIINISALGKRSVGNINMRDLYTAVVYGHVCAYLSAGVEIPEKHAPLFCEYMAFVFLKNFSKMFGITGSYTDLIPMMKFLVYLYVYQSFFGVDIKKAVRLSSNLAKFDPKDLKIDLSDYNFSNFSDFLLSLSDSQITPGLTNYKFLDKMIRNIGTMNLPFFEDIMRFSSILNASTINGNSYFTPSFQMYNPSLYFKVNSIIENVITKAM